MTKRKLTKHEDDILRNLRKNAEINPAQSPHDGIHTCSKGCKKPGCNRGLRETIEEQNAQIEALKQDLKEQAASVRNSRIANIHDLNHIGGLQEENARLKAEVERLRSSSFVTAVPVEEYEKLKAENERLIKAGDAMASSIQFNEETAKDYNGPTIVHQSVKAWKAAKEGKPSV